MADLSQILGPLAAFFTGQQQPPAPQMPQQAAQAPAQGMSAQTPPQQPAPPSGYQAPSGLEGFLSNPLVQGGLGAYLSLLAQPRSQGWGRGLGNAGLAGLGAFEAGEQQKMAMPYQAAKIQEMQAGAAGTQAQTQLAQRQLAPLEPQALQALQTWRQRLGTDPTADPQERMMADFLESQARGGHLSSQDVLGAIQKWDEQKRIMELYKAQGAMQGPAMMQWMFEAQAAANAGRPMPPMPSMTPPSMGAPSSGTAPPAAGPFDTTLPDGTRGKAEYFQDKSGKPTLFYLIGGKWTPATS